MIYDHLTPEQSQRAEALHAAATAFGSPAAPTDDYLVRAANWIITGLHDALFPLQVVPSPDTTDTPEDTDVTGGVVDGGGVQQLSTETTQQPRIGVNVGRQFSESHAGPALDEVDSDTDKD